MKVPQCSCGHPLDAHDVKSGECIFPPRCSCTRFFDVAGGQAASILDCFIKGGDLTAGGVMQAVTAAAQNVADGDRASEFEDLAFAVLATAAKN